MKTIYVNNLYKDTKGDLAELLAKGKLEFMKKAFGDNPVESHPEPKTTMYDYPVQRDPVHSSRPAGSGKSYTEARGTEGELNFGLWIADFGFANTDIDFHSENSKLEIDLGPSLIWTLS